MNKFTLIIEALYNSHLYFVNAVWHIVFNNKRPDYQMIINPIPKKRKKIDKDKFNSFMKRVTK